MARSNKQAAFDQSFDLFFETDDKGWKESGTWGANAFDTSFESDPFEFSAVGSSFHPAPTHSATLFPTDPFGKSGKPTVQVAILEQLSALYDDVSTEGSISVEGSVFVKPSKLLTNLPFCLVLRDLLDHVERCEEKSAVCHNINDKVSRKGLHKSDRVFRVTLPRQVATEVAIMDYVCVPTLRPVPILIKSRVRHSREFTRVGFKIRANPSNDAPLQQIMILLAVPPNMDGQSVRMSRQGGVWDEMKRTVAWAVDVLHPGEALEIQAQFLSVGGPVVGDRAPTFPVMVRCEYSKLFSSVEMLSDYEDSLSTPVRIQVNSSSRVLHRKV